MIPSPQKSFNQVIYKLYKNSESIIYYLNIVLILGHFIKKVKRSWNVTEHIETNWDVEETALYLLYTF